MAKAKKRSSKKTEKRAGVKSKAKTVKLLTEQPRRKANLDEWFDAVRSHVTTTAAGGAPTGACLVPDPNGGPSFCVEMTQESCAAVKGTWVGGDC